MNISGTCSEVRNVIESVCVCVAKIGRRETGRQTNKETGMDKHSDRRQKKTVWGNLGKF